MEITLLVKSFLGLIVILAILIFFLFYMPKKQKIVTKKKQKLYESKKSDDTSLDNLLKIIKDRTATSQELKEALDLVIKYHGSIHPKLGLRPHPDFDVYGEILLRICRHPSTNKDIILDFDRALEAKNEEYKKDINDFLTKGLNSRGV